ncbi:MAG: hypothetical protein ACD_73C00773G0005 [uncultured bacterium]|nr:MAG: hypothetical protein ACD_73C00773G0005 [uncultured bacterium]
MQTQPQQLRILLVIILTITLIHCGHWNIADELVTTDPLAPDGSIIDPLNPDMVAGNLYDNWNITLTNLVKDDELCNKETFNDTFLSDHTVNPLILEELAEETDFHRGNCVLAGGFQYDDTSHFLTQCIASGNALHMDETWVNRYLRCTKKVNLSTTVSVDSEDLLSGNATGTFEYSSGCYDTDKINKKCVFSFEIKGTQQDDLSF